jgi:hypothetical protein
MYLLPRRRAVSDFDCHHGVVDADTMVMVLEAASVASCGCGGCELAMSRDSGRTLGRYYWVWYAQTQAKNEKNYAPLEHNPGAYSVGK